MSYVGATHSSGFTVTGGSEDRTLAVPSGGTPGNQLYAVLWGRESGSGTNPSLVADAGSWSDVGHQASPSIPATSSRAFMRILHLTTAGGDPTSYTFTADNEGHNIFACKISLIEYEEVDVPLSLSGSGNSTGDDGVSDWDLTKTSSANALGAEATTLITLWLVSIVDSAEPAAFVVPTDNTLRTDASDSRDFLASDFSVVDELWESSSAYPARDGHWDFTDVSDPGIAALAVRIIPTNVDAPRQGFWQVIWQ